LIQRRFLTQDSTRDWRKPKMMTIALGRALRVWKAIWRELCRSGFSSSSRSLRIPRSFEDPRYYRLGNGSGRKRFLHAVEHAFVAHRDNGKRMFNFSEWLGTTSAVVLGNTYHPDNDRGFGPAAQAVGYSVIQDVGLMCFANSGRRFLANSSYPSVMNLTRLSKQTQILPVVE